MSESKPSKIYILTVEDSPTQSALLGYLLEKNGYQVISTKNGVDALDALEKYKPKLIISDVMMPDMDGFSLCRSIKGNAQYRHIPVLLMTALDGVEEIGKGLEAGADNFIPKPYQPSSLVSRVQALLEKLPEDKNNLQKVNLFLNGKKYIFQADIKQLLNLLSSALEDAAEFNRLLKSGQEAPDSVQPAVADSREQSLLTTLSNEIYKPMTGLLSLLELLSLSKLDVEQQSTLLSACDAGKLLLQNIHDVVDFSKMKSQQLQINTQATSIQSIVESLHYLYTATANRKGLQLSVDYDPKISAALLVDAMRLQQVLSHFMSNAIKFTSQGSVTLKAECLEAQSDGQKIRFSITDSGIGMTSEVIQKFLQPDPAKQTHNNMGLTICHYLITQMMGAVAVESEPGKGTTVQLTLNLPFADESQVQPPLISTETQDTSDALIKRRKAPSMIEAEKENTLILVVDDHPVSRNVLVQQLNLLGYSAQIASSGAQAMSMLQSKHFALLFTDYDMPGMDGCELARHIRKLEREESLKPMLIIAYTANALANAKSNCITAGMNDYLSKPVALMTLMNLLDKWLPIPMAHPIDRALITEIVGDDESAICDVLKDYQRAALQDTAKLQQAIKEEDMAQVTMMIHRIKGASDLIGAKALVRLCQKIETASRMEDKKAIEKYMMKFLQEQEQLQSYLSSICP